MSQLFSTAQIKLWDAYTIEHEPISSSELMERAARKCVAWIIQQWPDTDTGFSIFCGLGNNGGDGLAIARYLLESAYRVSVYVFEGQSRSEDNLAMLQELEYLHKPSLIQVNDLPIVLSNTIVIDAIFGTGINRAPDCIAASLIEFLNQIDNQVISIDIPSGLPSDPILPFGKVVEANYTLSFQQFKPSFLYPETGKFCGEVIVLDIELSPEFEQTEISHHFMIDTQLVQSLYKPRGKFSHKGHFGHALMIIGSHGKMGAAILASTACLKSGVGLLSVLVPPSENAILQQAIPEAMSITLEGDSLLPDLSVFDAVGIGSGLGTSEERFNLLTQLFQHEQRPLILDADALNLIAMNNYLLKSIPAGSLITPHPKEFDRLFGESSNSFERNRLQIEMSKKYELYIILKGRYTSVSTPEGLCYFNTTGNAGMAKGGSGDALTGVVTALYTQYQSMFIASIMGVYLHGKAGDLAASKFSKESMLASDLINCLGDVFLSMKND